MQTKNVSITVAIAGAAVALALVGAADFVLAATPATQPVAASPAAANPVAASQPASQPAAATPAAPFVRRYPFVQPPPNPPVAGTLNPGPTQVDPGAPINGQVQPTGPSANIVAPPVNGAAANATGQTLSKSLPSGDRVQAFKDNQWIGAQVLRRTSTQILVKYDGYPDSANEWIGPDRAR